MVLERLSIVFRADQTFNHNPETFNFTKMWHFILIKLSTVLPFRVTFQNHLLSAESFY